MNNLINISVIFSLLIACISALIGQLFSSSKSECSTGTAKERENKTEIIKCSQPIEKKTAPHKNKKQACVSFQKLPNKG